MDAIHGRLVCVGACHGWFNSNIVFLVTVNDLPVLAHSHMTDITHGPTVPPRGQEATVLSVYIHSYNCREVGRKSASIAGRDRHKSQRRGMQ